MEGFRVEVNSLDAYAKGAGEVADSVRGTASGRLAGQTVGGGMLGDIGEESGLHGRVEATIGSINGAANTGASFNDSLGGAVSAAGADYRTTEEAHQQRLRKLGED